MYEYQEEIQINEVATWRLASINDIMQKRYQLLPVAEQNGEEQEEQNINL